MPEMLSDWSVLGLWAVIGYVMGSVPFGIIITRAMGLGDLRQIGSGNIGATNVLRTGNRGAALATLLLDGAKGAAAVLIARALVPEDAVQTAALAAFLGHCFPVWLRFRGGKGVATHLGLMLALAWPVGLAACGVWLLTAAIFRYSSLAALVAAGWAPILAIILQRGDVVLLAVILGILVYIRHGANILRLRKGTEPRIGQKKAPAES
jgi:acyl phosphate:glycerol-3-phosphate acyltransferase